MQVKRIAKLGSIEEKREAFSRLIDKAIGIAGKKIRDGLKASLPPAESGGPSFQFRDSHRNSWQRMSHLLSFNVPHKINRNAVDLTISFEESKKTKPLGQRYDFSTEPGCDVILQPSGLYRNWNVKTVRFVALKETNEPNYQAIIQYIVRMRDVVADFHRNQVEQAELNKLRDKQKREDDEYVRKFVEELKKEHLIENENFHIVSTNETGTVESRFKLTFERLNKREIELIFMAIECAMIPEVLEAP